MHLLSHFIPSQKEFITKGQAFSSILRTNANEQWMNYSKYILKLQSQGITWVFFQLKYSWFTMIHVYSKVITHTYIFSFSVSFPLYHRLLRDIEYSSLWYSRSLFIYFMYSSLYLLIINSQFIPPLSSLATIRFFSMWVCFCCVCKFICVIL